MISTILNLFNSPWAKSFFLIVYTGFLLGAGYRQGTQDERNSQEAKNKIIVIKNLQDQILQLQKSYAVNTSIIDTLNKQEIQSKSFYEGLKDENNKLSGSLHTCYLSNKQLRLIQSARSGSTTKMSNAESTDDIIGISTTNANSLVNHNIDNLQWMHMCGTRYKAFQYYYYKNGGK